VAYTFKLVRPLFNIKLNQNSFGQLNKIVSAKITINEYDLLQMIAKDYFSKFQVIKQPTITEIVRYLIRSCINANFPSKRTQVQGTTNSHAPRPSYDDFVRQLQFQ
jgi:hypothetical protein